MRAILALPFVILGLPFFIVGSGLLTLASGILSWNTYGTYGTFNLKNNFDYDPKTGEWIFRDPSANWWRMCLIPFRFVIGWILFGISWPICITGHWVMAFADGVEYGFHRYRQEDNHV